MDKKQNAEQQLGQGAHSRKQKAKQQTGQGKGIRVKVVEATLLIFDTPPPS